MSNIVYPIGYMVLWIATLALYQYKNRRVDCGSIIMLSYIAYAYFAIETVLDPVFSFDFNFPLQLFPYIYLYVMLMIALAPIIQQHLWPATSLQEPRTRIFTFTACVIIVCSLFMLPDVISNFSSGFLKLFTDSDAGKSAYEENIAKVADSGGAIRNLPSVINNALSDLTIFLLFLFLTMERKKWFIILGLLMSSTIGLIIPLSQGMRGGVINVVLTTVVTYFLFKPYLSGIVNRAVKWVGVTAIGLISLPIAVITISRFGESSAGVKGFMYWYVGQGSLYFNNYGLDDGGIRYGDRTLNLFKRFVDSSTSKNYAERREKFNQLKINDEKFVTFVGDFTIDFGPYIAVVIFLLFYGWSTMKTRSRDGTLDVRQMLLLFFVCCVSIQGGMSLFTFSDIGGNLRIIALFALYGYVSLHEVLLKRFPKHHE